MRNSDFDVGAKHSGARNRPKSVLIPRMLCPYPRPFCLFRIMSNVLRKRTFAFLADQDFEGWAVVVDKTSLSDAFRVMHSLEFYLFFMTEVIRMIPEEKRLNATLILDEYGSPTKTKTELRKEF